MYRLFGLVIFAYAGISAALWGHVTSWLRPPSRELRCGNAITDPFGLLVNVVGPAAAVCAGLLVRRCIKARRWTSHAVTALFTFAITSACLAYEAHMLGQYGLEIGTVWWLPWR
jgi:hypothetical protein